LNTKYTRRSTPHSRSCSVLSSLHPQAGSLPANWM
jgi:hypothetical protein